MFFVSVAGPSVVVPAMAHAPGGAPPWCVWLRLRRQWRCSFRGARPWSARSACKLACWQSPAAPGYRSSRCSRSRSSPSPSSRSCAAGTTDTQSYAIDGNMIVLHHSPYVFTPATMAALGDKLAVGASTRTSYRTTGR